MIIQQEGLLGNPSRGGRFIESEEQQHAANGQPKNQCVQRRNEAGPQISALVGAKGLLPWKKVQKPQIEGLPQIAVLIPMRGKP